MKKSRRKLVMPFFVTAVMLGTAACANNDDAEGNNGNAAGDNNQEAAAGETSDEEMTVRIMAPSFAPEPVGNDSPALQEIEEYTNMDIELEFVANANYEDRFNVTLASGDLPDIMVAYKDSSFINATEDGAFWDVTDYMDDYENLSGGNDVILNNASINGRQFGIYRSRPLGRNGGTINTEWLENVGMEMPETIEDFHEVLRAFTFDDPNQSGEDDTYGMVVSEWEGPWDNLQVWMGVPNEWGYDDNGDLQPDFMFDEYREALDFFKELYDEGLVNEDFAVMDSGEWFDPIVNEQAGVVVDVLDQANRLQNQMTENYTEEDQVLDVFGAVEGPEGYRVKPTMGYHGVLAISRTGVETEEELQRVLQFLNDLNDELPQNLAYNGVEGVHHEITEDGDVNITAQEDGGELFDREVMDLNQFQMAIPEERFATPPQTALQEREEELLEENMEHVVPNPAEPLISDMYAERGNQLDNIVNDARIQYIVGQIDESGLDEAEEQWMNSGGDVYIEEINEAYQEAEEGAAE